MAMTPSNPEVPPAQEVIRRILRKRIRCTLSDGRAVVGEFQCLDKLRNFILFDADETVTKIDAASGEEAVVKRQLQQVMVPGKHLVKVEMEEQKWQAAQLRDQPKASQVK